MLDINIVPIQDIVVTAAKKFNEYGIVKVRGATGSKRIILSFNRVHIYLGNKDDVLFIKLNKADTKTYLEFEDHLIDIASRSEIPFAPDFCSMVFHKIFGKVLKCKFKESLPDTYSKHKYVDISIKLNSCKCGDKATMLLWDIGVLVESKPTLAYTLSSSSSSSASTSASDDDLDNYDYGPHPEVLDEMRKDMLNKLELEIAAQTTISVTANERIDACTQYYEAMSTLNASTIELVQKASLLLLG